jgi:hypothetical protein
LASTERSVPLVLGAYAACATGLPACDINDVAGRTAANGRISGFEIPFFDQKTEPWLSPAFLRGMPELTGSVVTLVPALFAAVKADPTIGLASTDEDGRRAAVAIVEHARRIVEQMPGQILAVQIQSSRRGAGTRDAFARSVGELASRSWSGAQLVIEHCDAPNAKNPGDKGFLPLEDELAVAASTGTGVVINWGRSALEGRSADRPLAHIEHALADNLLRGLMFSGVAGQPNVYGPEWADTHPPAQDVAPLSLLTAAHLGECIARALGSDPLLYLGAKYAAAPADDDNARVTLLDHAATQLSRAVDFALAKRDSAQAC